MKRNTNTNDTTPFNWDKLLKRLKNRKVIPVIGENLYTILTPEGKASFLYLFLAEELAKETGFELTPETNHAFAKTAFAFLNSPGKDTYQLQDFLLERIAGVKLSPDNRLR